MVRAATVRVDGRPVRKPAAPVSAGSRVEVTEPGRPRYVSRAGHKLATALDVFAASGLDVRGRRCLDVGASTGGFTQVLLERGAAYVVAVDVGHDQLHPRLRADDRVRVREGVNARWLSREHTGGPVGLAVADVSFISLTLLLPAVVEVVEPDGDLVVLVKPQFEVGAGHVGRGVVRSARQRFEAVSGVVDATARLGWSPTATTVSRPSGPAGNREYFCWFRGDAPPSDPEQLRRLTAGGGD